VDDAIEVAGSLHGVLATAGADPARAARLQLRLARAAVAAERWELAGAQLEQARSATEQVPGLHAELDALAAQLAIGTGDPDTAARLATAAFPAAQAAGRPEVACEALEVVGRAVRLTSLLAARDAFERASALAERHGLRLWQIRALHELGTVDLLGSGRLDRLAEARQLAADAGALSTVAVLDVQLAAGHLIRGERQLGLLAAQEAQNAGRRFRIPALQQSGLCFVASNKAMLLDRAGLEATAEELVSGGAEAYLVASIWGDGRAVYALLTEDRRAARYALECARELLPEPVHAPSPWWGLWTLVSALDGRDAEQALRAAQWSGEAVWSAMQFGYARAVLAGREHDRAGAEASFQAADALAAAFPWRRHLCRRLVAEAALDDGWGDPLDWLDEAATFFDSFPAPAVASACRSLRRKAGAPATRPLSPSVPAALAGLGVTEREAEVLELVGRGLSNRELAQRLYLSPRTVEKHVENLARKLGTRSRSQLVAYAATGGPTT
jgi:DNA-binding CsgD family transcriptional regulator